MQGERIRVKEVLKLLGITLVESLKYDAHFGLLATNVGGIAALLGRLPSNIGGPGNNVDPLYIELNNFMSLFTI